MKIILFIFLSFNISLAQIPFNTSPDWISTDLPNYGTGAGWADINKDGWVDLIVANGNDMARQKVSVYYNTGFGSLPTTPNWQSSDIDYHGHLSIGDIDRDGYPEVAVSVYIGASGFNAKGKVKLYKNNNGTLSSTPFWLSGDSMYTFSCAFGDANGDGYLDLAVACGESYNYHSEQMRIYYNLNGTLSTIPAWKSRNSFYGMDVTFADFDKDGKIDLAFVCERGPNYIFRNYGDSIGTVPYWTSTDASQYANSCFAGDVNNDGNIDLAVSDNNQLGGNGKFKIYINTGTTLNTTPFWTSSFSGYGSGITLADVDYDGYPDLICGGWWKPCWIYKNNNGNFNSTPQWTSSTNSVVEAIVFGDYDNDGLDTLTSLFTGNGIRKLFYLSRKPFYKILLIKSGSDTIYQNQYCFDAENGWINFSTAPASGIQLLIKYIASHDLDFAVSNWDANIGNYVFKNGIVVNAKSVAFGIKSFELYQNYPNPYNPSTYIKYNISESEYVVIKIYDMAGKEIETIFDGIQNPGTYEIKFDASYLPSGTYFYKLTSGSYSDTKKMIIVR